MVTKFNKPNCWFLFLCFYSHAGLCQNFAENSNTRYDVETDEPQFITKGHLYRAVVGDSITLPCKVKNLGSYILLWRRSANVLTAANLMVTRDARLKMVDGYNLQISDVKISDAGDYVCQIGDQEPRDQIHTLEILVPPSIRSVPDHGLVSARQGNTVNLECKSSGNPVPTIHWFRKVRLWNLITVLIVAVIESCYGVWKRLKMYKIRKSHYWASIEIIFAMFTFLLKRTFQSFNSLAFAFTPFFPVSHSRSVINVVKNLEHQKLNIRITNEEVESYCWCLKARKIS